MKLLKSLFVVAIVAVLTITATRSFFSDTEESVDNRFVAGAIDLKVDNTSHYNGYVCENGVWACEPWADFVYAFDQGVRKNGTPVVAERSDPTKALGPAQNNDTVNFVSLGFTTGIDGYIVLGFTNKILNESGNDLQVIETSYNNPSFDNYPEAAYVYVSQTPAGPWSYLGEATLDEQFDMNNGRVSDTDSTPYILEWARYVKLVDTSRKNDSDFPSDADGFDVDGVKTLHCSSEPEELLNQSCSLTWGLTDLGSVESPKFFNFSDIKPGDSGESTISLHIYNNDAYACMNIYNVLEDENVLIDPEKDDEDSSEGEGELADNMYFFMWKDDGDNIWEGNEPQITADPVLASSWTGIGSIFPIALPGDPMLTTKDYFVGLAWCAGKMTIGEYNLIDCDGNEMGNDSQTDKMSVDLSFYVEQSRNNSGFTCGPQVSSTNDDAIE